MDDYPVVTITVSLKWMKAIVFLLAILIGLFVAHNYLDDTYARVVYLMFTIACVWKVFWWIV